MQGQKNEIKNLFLIGMNYFIHPMIVPISFSLKAPFFPNIFFFLNFFFRVDFRDLAHHPSYQCTTTIDIDANRLWFGSQTKSPSFLELVPDDDPRYRSRLIVHFLRCVAATATRRNLGEKFKKLKKLKTENRRALLQQAWGDNNPPASERSAQLELYSHLNSLFEWIS